MTYLGDNECPLTGDQRLYRILMSESAYLIWKIRNKRVISDEGQPATKNEIKNKWMYAINDRLRMDCRMTNTHRYGKKALKVKLVEKTWSGVLRDEEALPATWSTGSTEVLVGIG